VIVPMSKVQVMGPRRLLSPALAFLQRQGVLDLRTPPAATARMPGFLRAVAASEKERASGGALEEALTAAERLLSGLPPAPRQPEEPLPPPGGPDFLARLASLSAERHGLEQRVASLEEEQRLLGRYRPVLLALAPLTGELPRGGKARSIGLVLQRDGRTLAMLEGELRRITDGNCTVQSRAAGEQQLVVLATVPEERAKEASALLFEHGVEEVWLPARCAGQPLPEALRLLQSWEQELPAQVSAARDDLLRFSGRVRPALRRAIRRGGRRLAQLEALASVGETAHAFVITGWVPRARVPDLEHRLGRALAGHAALVAYPPEPGEEADVPVVLENRALLHPFERLLALVPPPAYGSIDPTPYLAIFFPLLFGLILGDAGFGLVGIAASLAWRWRRWGGAAGRDYAAIALACSMSAVAFGLVFGEFFGDLGARFGLRPLLFDRRRGTLSFLGIALGVGVVHVGVGIALGAVTALRHRHLRQGIDRIGRLVLLAGVAVAGLGVAGVVSRAVLVPALAVGGAGVLLSLAGGGPMALLDVVLSLGNVLSYARLMALGLASALLGEVANRLATTVRPLAVGVALAIFLHAVNFTLGLVSPFIASLRLHYVEFFEKFYEGGGRRYRPFGLTR